MAAPIIHIPEPCSQNWNNMQPVDGCKRHCEVCNINLYDFSNRSLSDVQKILAENKDVIICGNYHERHTNSTKKVYAFTNALDTTFSKTKLKRFSLLVISLVLLFAGCARRVTKGCRAYAFGIPEKNKASQANQVRI